MAAAIDEGNQLPPASFPWEQQLCRRFPLQEIESVTQNFDECLLIGRGGFGKVYKGIIISKGVSTVAAIKRLDSRSRQGAPQFWAELEMLSKLRHCHIVPLIGYCIDGDEKILVYEYMPHGTLEDHLHKSGSTLSWVQRLKICIDAACGLHYLHTGTGTQQAVIHRDVKSSNILLDENWAAKISDFGLSKMGPANQSCSDVYTDVKGTLGYLDPEYFSTSRLTRKTDIYAFGVVLFEVLSGRRPTNAFDEEQLGLARWAPKLIKERKLDQIVDSCIRGQISPKCLKEFGHIANRCLHRRPKLRPTIVEVMVSLQCAMTLQEQGDSSTQLASFLASVRKALLFLFPSSGMNSVDSKLARNRKEGGIALLNKDEEVQNELDHKQEVDSKLARNRKEGGSALLNKDEEVENELDHKQERDGSVEGPGERRRSKPNHRSSKDGTEKIGKQVVKVKPAAGAKDQNDASKERPGERRLSKPNQMPSKNSTEKILTRERVASKPAPKGNTKQLSILPRSCEGDEEFPFNQRVLGMIPSDYQSEFLFNQQIQGKISKYIQVQRLRKDDIQEMIEELNRTNSRG